jgi:toxin-antitoxin system PIN domain toxin
MTALLDANVLVALVVAEHVHHDTAADWLSTYDSGFATCPITQGSLMRFLLRSGHSASAALEVVAAVGSASRHEFWPDDVSFENVALAGVIGHRQVTDAYLAQLARGREAQLATLDSGLAGLHADVAVLISTGRAP